jgi:hypothetical protein
MTPLTSTRTGRIVLHLMAAVGDHQIRWHWAGILREIRSAP